MQDRKNFHLKAGRRTPDARPGPCAGWADLLTDAAEGLLGKAEQTALDHHLLTCAACTQEFADAQRGGPWLAMLKLEAPEPSPELLGSIMARTTGVLPRVDAPSPALALVAPDSPSVLHPTDPGRSLPGGPLTWGADGRWPEQISGQRWRVRLAGWFGTGDGFPALQPHLAMTASMAFLSICVTLNLLGLSIRHLDTASLRPVGLHRSVADTGAALVRSFEGNRTVYRVQSRVTDWIAANSEAMAPAHNRVE